MVCGRPSWGELGLRTSRNVTLLPSGAHKNLPPLILPLPPPSFLAHKTPGAELWPLTSGPLLGEHPLSSKDPTLKDEEKCRGKERKIAGNRATWELKGKK